MLASTVTITMIAMLLLLSCSSLSVDPHNTRPTFGVLLTTIPQRMPVVFHAIASWLDQTVKPSVIFVCVPKRYRRFHREMEAMVNHLAESGDIRGTAISTKDLLHFYLSRTHGSDLFDKTVQILEVEKDWGPITKYMAVHAAIEVGLGSPLSRAAGVSHWVVGDDDVHYASNLLSRYELRIRSPGVGPMTVLSHFAPDIRVQYTRSVPVGSDGSAPVGGELTPLHSTREAIMHIQGVDTVCLAAAVFLSNELLGHRMLKLLVQYFHNVCPASFYQDDYVISFVLHIARLRVVSLWEPHVQVVDHVDQVSRSFDQMHMGTATVHHHEQTTKQCIVDFANRVYDVIHLCRTNANVFDKFMAKLNAEIAMIDGEL